jgi:hypothetical protein
MATSITDMVEDRRIGNTDIVMVDLVGGEKDTFV